MSAKTGLLINLPANIFGKLPIIAVLTLLAGLALAREDCLVPVCVLDQLCEVELPSCAVLSSERKRLKWINVDGRRLWGTPNRIKSLNINCILTNDSCSVTIVVKVNREPADCDVAISQKAYESFRASSRLQRQEFFESFEALSQTYKPQQAFMEVLEAEIEQDEPQPESQKPATPTSTRRTEMPTTTTPLTLSTLKPTIEHPQASGPVSSQTGMTPKPFRSTPIERTTEKPVLALLERKSTTSKPPKTTSTKTTTTAKITRVSILDESPRADFFNEEQIEKSVFFGHIFELPVEKTSKIISQPHDAWLDIRNGTLSGFVLQNGEKSEYVFTVSNPDKSYRLRASAKETHPLNHEFVTSLQKPLGEQVADVLEHIKQMGNFCTPVVKEYSDDRVVWICEEYLHEALCTGFRSDFTVEPDPAGFSTKFVRFCAQDGQLIAHYTIILMIFLMVCLPFICCAWAACRTPSSMRASRYTYNYRNSFSSD